MKDEMVFHVTHWGIRPDDIYYQIKYRGHYYIIQKSGLTNHPNILPCFDHGRAREKIHINQEYTQTYKELLNLYDNDVLHNLFLTLFNMGLFYYEYKIMSFYYNRQDTSNEEILNWLDTPLVIKEIKNFVLRKAEWAYLVGNKKEGKYKIGMTKRTPTKRITEFSPLLPFEVEIIAQCPTGNARRLEKELHNRFANKRTNGEWFELSEDDVIYIRSMSI